MLTWAKDLLPNESHDYDYIDLNDGRDFLKERLEYDVVLVMYLYRGCQEHEYRQGYFATSELSTPAAWRNRLQATKARLLFIFGGQTEVSGSFIGDIPGYVNEKMPMNFHPDIAVLTLDGARKSRAHEVRRTLQTSG
jgi:hypothetical protein